ncbi:MAG: ribosome rescue protein RqcH [Candidatus Bathyarchaeota archaeon]|nr:ribosome rescue protein RqcH [Candidatus Bathyarchaeota archaeon]
MKAEMTSFDIALITSELNQLIRDARIDNIYQLNHVTLVLKLRQPSQPPYHLLIEAGKRVHLTSYALKKPQRPPAFCMALRKHLRNGRVIEVEQHEFERIVIIRVSTGEGEFQLVSELFGEGNIILVSPQNEVLHALTYRRMRDRNILRGEVFRQAPPRGKNPKHLSQQELDKIRGLGRLETVRALTKFLSIGGLYAEEILLRAKVDKNVPCESLREQEIDRIFVHLRRILSLIAAGETEPRIITDDNDNRIDVVPIPLEKYAHLKQKVYKTFEEAVDEYYMGMVLKEKQVEADKGAGRELEKQQRILQSQQKALEDLGQRAERNRKIGDAIFAHLGELQHLVQKIMDEKKRGKPWKQIVSDMEEERDARRVPAVYFHSLEPRRLILNVSVEGLLFSLNLRHSVQADASRYYTSAKKAAKKLKGAEKAMRDVEAKISELQRERVEQAREITKPPPKRRKKAWYEKFRWFRSSDGFLVIGGRDATTNEILIKKHMEPQDIVFHADIPGAPFVLIKTEGKTPSQQTIGESAQLAASYSRAWREMLGAVDVYWFSPEQVSKSPPSGQHLKKGAFMIRGSKNYVRNVPLRVAVGVEIKEEQPMIIGGPVDAVSKQTSTYVEIIPGKQSSGGLAKQIRKLLAKKAPKALEKRVQEIPLEEIQKFIPSGRGTVSPGVLN